MNKDFKAVSVDFRDNMTPPKQGLEGALDRAIIDARTLIMVLPIDQASATTLRISRDYMELIGVEPGADYENFEISELDNKIAMVLAYDKNLHIDMRMVQMEAQKEGISLRNFRPSSAVNSRRGKGGNPDGPDHGPEIG